MTVIGILEQLTNKSLRIGIQFTNHLDITLIMLFTKSLADRITHLTQQLHILGNAQRVVCVIQTHRCRSHSHGCRKVIVLAYVSTKNGKCIQRVKRRQNQRILCDNIPLPLFQRCCDVLELTDLEVANNNLIQIRHFDWFIIGNDELNILCSCRMSHFNLNRSVLLYSSYRELIDGSNALRMLRYFLQHFVWYLLVH